MRLCSCLKLEIQGREAIQTPQLEALQVGGQALQEVQAGYGAHVPQLEVRKGGEAEQLPAEILLLSQQSIGQVSSSQDCSVASDDSCSMLLDSATLLQHRWCRLGRLARGSSDCCRFTASCCLLFLLVFLLLTTIAQLCLYALNELYARSISYMLQGSTNVWNLRIT
jgi:hypothetical protein